MKWAKVEAAMLEAVGENDSEITAQIMNVCFLLFSLQKKSKQVHIEPDFEL